ncbi:MAG: rhomboid family intramembrane serine protease [Granulosicoccus sp.]
MIFPIRDENPQINVPYVTYAFIALNLIAWVALQGMGVEPALSQSVCQFGLVPADLTGQELVRARPICTIDGKPDWYTLVSSVFMHGSWMHLIGNMWFLWIFGNNVEDSMGGARFAVFYLLTGVIASITQIVTDTGSVVPMVGASGAIGGVMGAYIVLYPKVHVHMFFLFRTFAIPAILMLGYWVITQLIGGFSSIGSVGGGVAFWAHAGGFLSGMALILFFKDEKLLANHPYHGWTQSEHHEKVWQRVPTRKAGWH